MVSNKKLYKNIVIIIVQNSGLSKKLVKAGNWWWWCQEQLAKRVDDRSHCQAQSPKHGAPYCSKMSSSKYKK